MSQVERERRKAEKMFIEGKACGMLESGQTVAKTVSELPVSRRSIEMWGNRPRQQTWGNRAATDLGRHRPTLIRTRGLLMQLLETHP